MQRHIKILLVGIMILAVAACGSSGDPEIAAGRPCAEVQNDLDAAQANATEQAGTPAESDTADAITRLEEELESCDDGSSDDEEAATTTEVPTDEEDEAECPSSWLILASNKENNRWFADGLQEIREASSPEEAWEAANTWLSLVRRDPQLLVGAVAYFLDGRQVDPASLVDEDEKCATSEAVSLTAQIELSLADSEVVPDEAPADGTNSGTNGVGDVVASETPGISGETKAIKITTPDGKEIWILARCGNPVVKGPAPVPPGPTDQPPSAPPAEPSVPPGTTPPRECPPDKPHGEWPVCKDDPSRDPAQQGNLPPGGGGAEEGGSDEGGPRPPAGRPPTTYVPPPPPTVPPTTRPGPPPTPPSTTSPPATLPPTTVPPTTEIPAPRSPGHSGGGGAAAAGLLVPFGGLAALAARRRRI